MQCIPGRPDGKNWLPKRRNLAALKTHVNVKQKRQALAKLAAIDLA